eukprot:TRINITY_DN8693_c0_g3_i1.p1 TRINITY_DN8693_c0_g3~~TRINITY_DN8693_c0_g3_i1.p1  ORF type:complete len:530 (+),score=161.40 TRINITY_DN8693_c0_g3_i1:34-1623(+)
MTTHQTMTRRSSRYSRTTSKVDCRRAPLPVLPPCRPGHALWKIAADRIRCWKVVRYVQRRVAGVALGCEEERVAQKTYEAEWIGRIRGAAGACEFLLALNIDATVEVVAAKAPLRCANPKYAIWGWDDVRRILERVKGQGADNALDLHSAFEEIPQRVQQPAMGREALRRATLDIDALRPGIWSSFPKTLNVQAFVNYFGDMPSPAASHGDASALSTFDTSLSDVTSTSVLTAAAGFENDDDIAASLSGELLDLVPATPITGLTKKASMKRRRSERRRDRAHARQRWAALAAAVHEGDLVAKMKRMIRSRHLFRANGKSLCAGALQQTFDQVVKDHAQALTARRASPVGSPRSPRRVSVLSDSTSALPACPNRAWRVSGRVSPPMAFHRTGSFCRSPNDSSPWPTPPSRDDSLPSSRRGSRSSPRNSRFKGLASLTLPSSTSAALSHSPRKATWTVPEPLTTPPPRAQPRTGSMYRRGISVCVPSRPSGAEAVIPSPPVRRRSSVSVRRNRSVEPLPQRRKSVDAADAP